MNDQENLNELQSMARHIAAVADNNAYCQLVKTIHLTFDARGGVRIDVTRRSVAYLRPTYDGSVVAR